MKYTSSLKGRLGWQGLKAEEYRDDGPFVVSSAHFRKDRIVWDMCPHVSWERYRLDANIQLREGDVLLMKDGAALGKLAFLDRLPGPACLNSHLLLFRPRGKSYEPRFLYYYMGTTLFQDYILVRGTGATFLGVSQETIGNHELRLPPIGEQRAIANFLDRKTTAIDALIVKKERLIDLLQEKRQALITQAVTKGLNPNVPMKASGVEWLGQIPATWEVLPIRRILSRLEQGWSPESEDRRAEGDEWAVLKLSAVSRGRFRPDENKVLPPDVSPELRYQVRAGDLLVTRANTPLLVGDACFVEHTPGQLMLPDLIYRLTLDERRALPAFVAQVLLSAPLRGRITSDARGSSMTMAKVSGGHIRSWLIPLPGTLDEQRRIVQHVGSACRHIDETCHKIAMQLDLLREYRQGIITAAVTGKIDVSKEAA